MVDNVVRANGAGVKPAVLVLVLPAVTERAGKAMAALVATAKTVAESTPRRRKGEIRLVEEKLSRVSVDVEPENVARLALRRVEEPGGGDRHPPRKNSGTPLERKPLREEEKAAFGETAGPGGFQAYPVLNEPAGQLEEAGSGEVHEERHPAAHLPPDASGPPNVRRDQARGRVEVDPRRVNCQRHVHVDVVWRGRRKGYAVERGKRNGAGR